jgi:hypothetical protein
VWLDGVFCGPGGPNTTKKFKVNVEPTTGTGNNFTEYSVHFENMWSSTYTESHAVVGLEVGRWYELEQTHAYQDVGTYAIEFAAFIYAGDLCNVTSNTTRKNVQILSDTCVVVSDWHRVSESAAAAAPYSTVRLVLKIILAAFLGAAGFVALLMFLLVSKGGMVPKGDTSLVGRRQGGSKRSRRKRSKTQTTGTTNFASTNALLL